MPFICLSSVSKLAVALLGGSTLCATVNLYTQVREAGNRWARFIEAVCLVLIMFLCLSTRLFPTIRGEATIYDFDPYFNHRTTKYLANAGFSDFWNWYDDGEPFVTFFLQKASVPRAAQGDCILW